MSYLYKVYQKHQSGEEFLAAIVLAEDSNRAKEITASATGDRIETLTAKIFPQGILIAVPLAIEKHLPDGHLRICYTMFQSMKL